jgi:hypothetical protein
MPLAGPAKSTGLLQLLIEIESKAAGLTHVPLLAFTADDGFASDTDALVRAIEGRGGRKVTWMHVTTDYNGQIIGLRSRASFSAGWPRAR